MAIIPRIPKNELKNIEKALIGILKSIFEKTIFKLYKAKKPKHIFLIILNITFIKSPTKKYV